MHTGFAIALAWPRTACKQAGAWYDGLMDLLGFSKAHYYRVGHAAVVLIESGNGNCHYFDFGRYHAPFGHGRVRDAETDHELRMKSKAIFSASGNELLNFEEILEELCNNDACHGTGDLHASYTKINFEKAFAFARKMQEKSPWKYGPFTWNGTNCSRFVRSVLLSGEPALAEKIRLSVPLSLTPAPSGNVNCLKNKIVMESLKPHAVPETYSNNPSCPAIQPCTAP